MHFFKFIAKVSVFLVSLAKTENLDRTVVAETAFLNNNSNIVYFPVNEMIKAKSLNSTQKGISHSVGNENFHKSI